MARVNIKQKAQNLYAGVKNTARSFVEPRVTSPVPYSIQNQGKLYAPALSNITANLSNPRNLLSAVPTDVRTAVPKFISKINTNVNFLRQNPGARKYALSTSGDFIRGDYGLSQKSKSPLVQGIRENVGDLAQQNLSGFVTAGKGVGNIRSKGLLNKAQGLSQIVGGLSSSYLTATPLGVGTTILSNTPRMGRVDVLRRLASGAQSSFAPGEKLDTNVPSQEIQIGFGDGGYRVDPLKAVGAMAGYVMRPENRRFFQMTEKILPGSSNSLKVWATVTGIRGGVEGIFSGLQTLPEGLSSKEKLDYMTKQGFSGVASELLVRGAFKGAKATGKKLLKTDMAGSNLVDARNEAKKIPHQKVNKYLVKMFNDLLKVRDRLAKGDFEKKTMFSPNGSRLINTGEYAKAPEMLADYSTEASRIQPSFVGGGFDRQTRLIDDPRTPGRKVAIYTDTNEPVIKGAITKRAQRDSIGIENMPGYVAPSYLKRDLAFGVGGAQAGWEKDEEGNLRYNPIKGATGAYLAVNASRGMTGRKTKIGLTAEEITDEGRRKLGTQVAKVGSQADLRPERGFVTNVKGSQVALPETKAGLTGKSAIYDPITNKQTIQQTKFDIDTEGWDASKKRVFDEPLSADTNILGQQLIKRAQDEGRFDEAIEIVEKLAKKGTEAGQAVQAFSVWGKLTPEGMLKYAVNQVDTAKQQMGYATKMARKVFGSETPEIKPEDAKVITDLMKKAQMATTEQEQADYARSALEYIGKKIPWGVSEVIDEYRYNNMLSGPLTHLRNLYSNVLQSGLVRPATLVAQGKPLEAIKYEKAVLKTIPDAFSKAIDVFKTGKKLQRLDDVLDGGAQQFKPKRLGKLYNIPSSALEASDTFFTTLIKQGELARGATKEEAQKAAEYWVFRQGLNAQQQGVLLNSIDNMTKGIYGLRKVGLGWVIPFLQTPMNVAKQGIEFSPAGVLTTIGAKNKGEQLAKAGIGSVVSLIGLSLAMQDRTTWDVPVDKSQRELFYASGKKPYSIKVGDKWVPMQYLGPFAWSVGLPAAYKHYQENSRTALTDSQLKKLMSATMSGAKFWSQQTFMQGLGQFVKLAEGDADYDLPKIVSNFASQVNPMTSLQRYVAQVVDPVFRKAGGDTFMQKVTQQLQTGIPGQSKKLEAYVNPLGEESKRNVSNYMAPWGMGQEDKRFTGALKSRERITQINAFVTGIENEYEPDIEKATTQISKQIEGEVLSGLDLTDEQRLEAIKKIQSRVRSKVKKSVMASRSKDIAKNIRKSWGDTPEEKREFLKVMKDRGLLTTDILDALLNG